MGVIKNEDTTDYTLQQLKNKFINKTKHKNINKMDYKISNLLEKYELDNLFKKQKEYLLDNKKILFTEGAIVKSKNIAIISFYIFSLSPSNTKYKLIYNNT